MPHPYPEWLHRRRRIEGGRFAGLHLSPVEARRRLADIERYLEPEQIYSMIVTARPWPYRRRVEHHQKRDRALLALLYLSGLRISEALRIKKSQFDLACDPDFVVVRDVKISKRKKKTIQREGQPMIDVPLPKTGRFSRFTDLILDYLQVADEDVFKIGSQRAWAIVKHMTGRWNHYFRSQRISWLVNRLRSDVIAARIVGIKNPQTIAHYYKGEWRAHRDELK